METKIYSLQEIDNLLTYLLLNTRSASNTNKVGEEERKTATEDGVTLDMISGISIQYDVEDDIDLIYVFTKSGNKIKSYSGRIIEEDLDVWEKLRREARYKFRQQEIEKNSNVYTLQGQCLQYYNRDCDLSINERAVLNVLLDRSFALRKRWCCLRYSDFPITNSSSLKKTLDSLMDKKLITYTNTFKDGKRGLNEYAILEPKVYINNFDFTNENEDV